MKQEVLVTCPDCGTTGIFANKLEQHRKGKNCADKRSPKAVVVSKGVKPLTIEAFENLGPDKAVVPNPDAEMGSLLTAQYLKATGGMVEVLKFGAMMIEFETSIEATRAIDSTRGANSKGAGRYAKGTGFKAWLKEHAPTVKEGTAYRLRGVTEAIAEDYETIVGAKIAKQFALPALVTTPADKLPDAAKAKQLELFNFVSGTSQRSWLDRLKAPAGDGRANNNPGYRPNTLILRAWLKAEYPDNPEYLETEVFKDLPADVQKRFKAEGERYEKRLTKEAREEIEREAEATDWLERAPGFLASGMDRALEDFADADQLKRLADLLGDYAKQINRKLASRPSPKALPAK